MLKQCLLESLEDSPSFINDIIEINESDNIINYLFEKIGKQETINSLHLIFSENVNILTNEFGVEAVVEAQHEIREAFFPSQMEIEMDPSDGAQIVNKYIKMGVVGAAATALLIAFVVKVVAYKKMRKETEACYQIKNEKKQQDCINRIQAKMNKTQQKVLSRLSRICDKTDNPDLCRKRLEKAIS